MQFLDDRAIYERSYDNVLGLLVSTIFYYVNNKKLNENQKDPKLHYFIFDHFVFRWLPNGFRKWARFGLINPELETVRDPWTLDRFQRVFSLHVNVPQNK